MFRCPDALSGYRTEEVVGIGRGGDVFRRALIMEVGQMCLLVFWEGEILVLEAMGRSGLVAFEVTLMEMIEVLSRDLEILQLLCLSVSFARTPTISLLFQIPVISNIYQ